MDAKLTAYALNELSPDERAAFEARMKIEPALQKQAEELKAFCSLIEREIAENADEALMPSQRATLVQSFQIPRKIIRPLWRRPSFLSTLGFAAAACLAVMLTLLQVKHPGVRQAPTTQLGDLRQDQPVAEKDADQARAAGSIAAGPTLAKKMQSEMGALGVDSPPAPVAAVNFGATGQSAPSMPTPVTVADSSDNTLRMRSAPPPPAGGTASNNSYLAGTTSMTKTARGTIDLNESSAYTGGTTVNGNRLESAAVPAKAKANDSLDLKDASRLDLTTAATTTTSAPSPSAPRPVPAPATDSLAAISQSSTGGAWRETIRPEAGVKFFDELPPAAKRDMPVVDLVAKNEAPSRGLELGISDPETVALKSVGAAEENREPVQRYFLPQSQPGAKGADTATYRPIIENPFTYVAQQPLSTFSLDVDTASYANVRRLLNSGQRPPPDAVRLEELINYFPYHYEGPAAGRPLAVQIDLADAPWQPLHRIARVATKAREVKGERAAANFVFLLDVSGSMEPQERLPLIKQSLRLLVDQMREDDRVSIVTYAGESGVALESTSGAQKEKLRQAIQKLKSGGSTNGASGIRLAYEQAALNFSKEHINRVILCTDGDFNVGTSNVQELEKLIAEHAKSGVFLSVLGVGTDNLHDHTMQALADRGNGNYHYLDSVGEARKVLVEQMTGTLIAVAKDVKLQVEFNPAQVAAYRLIGYEKRTLAKEDFNNDRKDAGEIGAGQTVTALYEIVPASLKYPDGKPLVDKLKYQGESMEAAGIKAQSAETQLVQSAIRDPLPATETMTVKVRYKEPNGDQSKLFEVSVTDAQKKLSENDRDFQFAVSVAGFGMLLRGSPNAAELTWERVRQLALAGKGEDEQGWRGEFIQLIEKARGLGEAGH